MRPIEMLAYKAAVKAERERAEKVRQMLWPSPAMVKAEHSAGLGSAARKAVSRPLAPSDHNGNLRGR